MKEEAKFDAAANRASLRVDNANFEGAFAVGKGREKKKEENQQTLFFFFFFLLFSLGFSTAEPSVGLGVRCDGTDNRLHSGEREYSDESNKNPCGRVGQDHGVTGVQPSIFRYKSALPSNLFA